MEKDIKHGDDGQPGSKTTRTSPKTIAVLTRYSHGEISDWEAAELLGRTYTQHDVFDLIRTHKIPLPLPPKAELARQKSALEKLFGTARRTS